MTETAPVPPWPTTLAALLSLALFSVADGFSLVIALLAAGLLAVYLVATRLTRATRQIWTARLTLFGVVLALNAGHQTQLADTWMTSAGLDRFVPLLAAEMVIRAWSSPPGARQMLLLSGFVVLGGCSTSDDRIGLYFVPAYFAAVVLALRADRPRRVETRLAPRLWRGLAVLLALLLGAAARWGFIVYQAQILALGGQAFAAAPHHADAEVSGIEKDPQLGATFDSPGSSTRIYLINGGLPDPHLRGMAFDIYGHGAWSPTLDERHFDGVTRQQLDSSAPGPRVRFTRLADDDGMVSAPLNCAGVDLQTRSAANWARPVGGPLRLETDGPLSYDVIFSPAADYQGPLAAPPDPAERARCLVVPSGIDPRLPALARKIIGRLRDPRRKADAVQNYLMTHNAYSYAARPGPGDPVSDFVLNHRSGHCEFFASSATILLRCVGVPTRYVIGYYAHESDGPGRLVVRGQDAHAWAESWIDGVGWVTVDATPGNGRPSETARTPFWWKIQDRWQDFQIAVQQGLSASQRLALISVLAAVLLASTLLRAWRSRLRAATAFAYPLPPGALPDLAARFETLLDRRGAPCPPDRPWQEHLSRLKAGETHPGGGTHPGSPSLATPPCQGGEQETIFLTPPLNRGRTNRGRTGEGLFDLTRAEAFVSAYNRARFGTPQDAAAAQEAAQALRELETAA